MLTGVQGSGSHSVHHRGPAFSCYATQERVFLSAPLPGSCLQFCPKEKNGGKKPSGVNTPLSILPRAALSAVCHSTKLKLPHCTCCVKRQGTEGARPPQKRPLVHSVSLQKSSRQARPILALALSHISWLMLGMNTGGFPNRRPPVASNSPPLARIITHCGAGDSPAAACPMQEQEFY